MSSAFSAGMIAIFADPNIGMDVMYRPADDAAGLAVRSVKSAPSSVMNGLATMGVVGQGVTYDLLQSDILIKPTKSASISVDGGITWLKVNKVTTDTRELTWELTLG